MKPFYRSRLGVLHSWERDEGNTIRIKSEQDATPFLEWNKAAANHNDGYAPGREFRRVASIPPIVQIKWMNEFGVDPLHPHNHDLLCRLLNSSDWSYLRTAPGQISAKSGEMH